MAGNSPFHQFLSELGDIPELNHQEIDDEFLRMLDPQSPSGQGIQTDDFLVQSECPVSSDAGTSSQSYVSKQNIQGKFSFTFTLLTF
jgi:hypothetical protein